MKYTSCLLVLVCIACHAAAQQVPAIHHPPDTAALFAEGAISTPFSERDFALSPDGNEMFYTLQTLRPGGFQTILHRMRNSDGSWTAPAIAPFSGNYSDLEPAFTSDGKRLFFCSNRPLDGNKAKDFDIWMVEKINGKWQTPKNLGEPVNTPADEFYPSVAKNGNLYFTATYKGGPGREDIYRAEWKENAYVQPVALDSGVNSGTYEFNAFVSPTEDYIIFTSYGRKEEMGGGDLYMSVKDKNGKWLPAKHLGILNSNKMDYCPFVSFDNHILFFTSERSNLLPAYDKGITYPELEKTYRSALNGGGNIYWVSFAKILSLYR